MAKKKTVPAPKVSGAEHAKKAGLVAISLLVSPEEREAIRVAAAKRGQSMAAFARAVVVEAAGK